MVITLKATQTNRDGDVLKKSYTHKKVKTDPLFLLLHICKLVNYIWQRVYGSYM